MLAAFIMVFLLIMVNCPHLASSACDSSRSYQASEGRHQLRMPLSVGSMDRTAPAILCFIAPAIASPGCYCALAFSRTALCCECCPPANCCGLLLCSSSQAPISAGCH